MGIFSRPWSQYVTLLLSMTSSLSLLYYMTITNVTPTSNRILLHTTPTYWNLPDSNVQISTNPQDWPTETQMRQNLVAPTNRYWFWSGRLIHNHTQYNHCKSYPEDSCSAGYTDVISLAQTLALQSGGKTLEMSITSANFSMSPRRGLTISIPGQTDYRYRSTWPVAAKAFARNAEGDHVHVLLGDELRIGNAWERDELNEIITNGRVGKVIAVRFEAVAGNDGVATGERVLRKEVIWEKGKGK